MTLPSRLSHQRTTAPPTEGGSVPRDDSDVGVASFASQEGGVERAGNKGPEGAADYRVVLEHAADKQRRLPDDGREWDDRVVVSVPFSAEDRREESGEGEDIGEAARVMLNTAAKRGEERHGAFAAVEEVLQEGGEAQMFLWWYGDGAQESINHDASVGDTLRRVLTFVVAKAQAERVGETMPERLGASRGAGRLRADRNHRADQRRGDAAGSW
jgi:hypothetical protein